MRSRWGRKANMLKNQRFFNVFQWESVTVQAVCELDLENQRFYIVFHWKSATVQAFCKLDFEKPYVFQCFPLGKWDSTSNLQA